MNLILRIIAWLLTAAVTFATLGPPGYRPHSMLGQDGEHALAFVLVGLAFGLAYPQRRLLTAGIAVVLIGVLELVLTFMVLLPEPPVIEVGLNVAPAPVGNPLALKVTLLVKPFDGLTVAV